MNVPTDTTLPADSVAARIAALRDLKGLTQEQVAERSGGKLTRVEANKVESGKNKATSDKIRSGLAAAFDVSRERLADYLEGRIDLATLVRPAPATAVERPERYENRAIAAEFALRSGVDPDAVQIVCTIDYLSDEDHSPQEWLDMMKVEAAKLKMARKDPGAVERDKKAGRDALEAAREGMRRVREESL